MSESVATRPRDAAPGKTRFNWRNASAFIVLHGMALLALDPWFFTWTGVWLAVAGYFIFGMLGINIGYHRLLTHRGLYCPLWFERTLVLLGTCCMQESPPYWVAIHRQHHHFADAAGDPHTPNQGFFWGHMGWLLVKPDSLKRGPLTQRYARELMRDDFYEWLEKGDHWMKIALASWAIFFGGGYLGVIATGGTLMEALQFAMSLLIWGVAVRTVVLWHLTWSVNSVSHLWGYRNYETADTSRNNPVLAILGCGEGWHNNHHADPRSARHGHTWWELDLSWMTIRALMAIGLVKEAITPSPSTAARSSRRT